jgi:hypothetical protein
MTVELKRFLVTASVDGESFWSIRLYAHSELQAAADAMNIYQSLGLPEVDGDINITTIEIQ